MDIQLQATPERITASITRVVDSLGNSIPNPGTTQDTVLTVTGSGTASSVIFIYDNGVLLTTASVTINGTWSFSPETLVLGRHAFTVRDEPGGVDSPAWVVTVGEAVVKPEITLVTDSNGEVAHNGPTFDTTVTLNGTAKANEAVELFQDSALQGDVPVNGSGAWTRPVTGLTVRSHNFQVRGRYDSNPVSGVRSLTVLASEAPTISSIKDAAGVEIPPNTTTFSASVTLTGTAAAGQQVQIFDGASSLGTVTATGTTWTLAVTGLAFRAYSVRARGLYGSNPESAVRGFTIADAIVPLISLITDAAGNQIPPDGTAIGTSVTLNGTAAAEQVIDILDGDVSAGTTNVTGTGSWVKQLSGLSSGQHRFNARGLYGNHPVSPPYTITLQQANSGTEDFDGGRVLLPSNTRITLSSGLAITAFYTAPYEWPVITGGHLRVRIDFGYTVELLFELSGSSRTVDVFMSNYVPSNPVASITYFNASGTSIGYRPVPVTSNFVNISFSAPAGQSVASFRLFVGVVTDNPYGSIEYIRWRA